MSTSHVASSLLAEEPKTQCGDCLNSRFRPNAREPGGVWSNEQIPKNKAKSISIGFNWRIIDNLRVHDHIKIRGARRKLYVENYKKTLVNLAKCGAKEVGFDFMPVFYKVRTHYGPSISGQTSFALFDPVAFCLFDIYFLRRFEAEMCYSALQLHKAKIFNKRLGAEQKRLLCENILSAIPNERDRSINSLLHLLEIYKGISDADLKQSFDEFHSEIGPVAEELKLLLYVNTDNPAAHLLSLPSITSYEGILGNTSRYVMVR
jgi:mannonate dehydratase